MTEYCSSMSNTTKNKGHFFSDFALLCSFIFSHPLYFSYFVFFSPYLLKILAFLSPLFITTILLLTSILHDRFSFSSFYENLQLRFGDNEDESIELDGFEELEVYKIVFGSSEFDLFSEDPCDENEEKVLGVLISGEGGFQVKCRETLVEFSGEIEERICGIPIVDDLRENPYMEEVEEEKILGVLISDEWDFPSDGCAGKGQNDEVSGQETAKCGKLTSGVGKEEEDNPTITDKKYEEVLTASSINGGKQSPQKEVIKNNSWNTNHSNSTTKKHDNDNDDDDDSFSYSSSQSQPVSPSLSNIGSMRKEKEWRRTLACKLFEERHNVSGGGGGGGGGGEGMDMLWEAYEKTEENRGKQSSDLKKKDKDKYKKNRGEQSIGLKKTGENRVVANYVLDYGDGDEEDEEEEDEVDNGKLCCLQALKFSAGKMNFGMGRPGFSKISKAFKGIGGGWLNNHHQRRQQSGGGSKKGKNS